MRGSRGFTLIELMIVVCLIGILAAIAQPMLAKCIHKAQESKTMGNLAALRASLAMYEADNGTTPPTGNPVPLLVPRYIEQIPNKLTPPYHPEGNSVGWGPTSSMTDANEDWFYVSDQNDPAFGSIRVNCIHQTIGGRIWQQL